MPDFSTLCRRQKTVTIQIPFRRAGGPLNLLVDSTGVKMRGDGEWQVRKHGPSPLRVWAAQDLVQPLEALERHGRVCPDDGWAGSRG